MAKGWGKVAPTSRKYSPINKAGFLTPTLYTDESYGLLIANAGSTSVRSMLKGFMQLTIKNPFKQISFRAFSFSKINFTELLDMAAALAFYMSLSLSPLIVLIVATLTAVNPDLQEKFLEQVRLLSGGDGAEILKQLMESQASEVAKVTSQALGVIIILISSSAIFGQLRQSFDKIFFADTSSSSEENPEFLKVVLGFLKQRVFHVGLVISFILVLIVSLLASSYLIYLTQAFIVSSLYQFAVNILSYLVFALYFFLMFYFIPSHKIPMKMAWIGGFLTALLFIIGKYLIGIYIGTMGVGSSFGAAGTIIVIMAWVYYSSFIIFVCAKAVSMLTFKRAGEL